MEIKQRVTITMVQILIERFKVRPTHFFVHPVKSAGIKFYDHSEIPDFVLVHTWQIQNSVIYFEPGKPGGGHYIICCPHCGNTFGHIPFEVYLSRSNILWRGP